MLKAVIFDMDGVLIDSEPQHARAAVLALKKLDVDITIDYCYGFIGSTTQHMLETMIKDFNLNVTVNELITLYNTAKDELIKSEGYEAIPFTKELIIDLFHHGIKLAIASSSTQNEINDVVKSLNLSPYFYKLVSGADVKNPKPAPDVFLKAMNEINVNADECIIIEDSHNGVRAAKAAGIPAIGFVNKNSGNQDLSDAYLLIEGFEEIDYNFINKTYLHANNLPVTIAVTNRLIIRELTAEDIPALYRIYQLPDVKKYINDISDDLNIEIEKLKAYIKNIYHFYEYGYWGVFLKETNQLIGRCGIQNNRIDGKEEIEIGYLFDSSYWGNGYATEAADAVIKYANEKLEINRIAAVIDINNFNSIQLAERIHMKKEKVITKDDQQYFLYVKAIDNPKK